MEDTLRKRFEEIAKRYVDNSKEINDMVSEMLAQPEIVEQYHSVLRSKSYNEQIADINQWTSLLLSNRGKIRERVLWSMIADINNRTTD
jgi:ribonuclease HIII